MTVHLALHEVTKVYGSGNTEVRALDDVSLQVATGEMVAVMGTSGSGKSTLLSVAGALLQPTAGEVYLDGEDISVATAKTRARLRRDAIGFVFQDFNLVPSLTVLENVALPLDLAGAPRATARSEARRALAAVKLRDRSSSFPDELSGGQRQRVAIARAIVGRRELLLADEPTGALDSVTGDTVLSTLRERADEGAAVVLVTHDARHAAWADRVVYLADGRIVDQVAASSPDGLLAGTVG
jgi:putative ABC transport system ATP-binding protein